VPLFFHIYLVLGGAGVSDRVLLLPPG
jgi:hypothetical protein